MTAEKQASKGFVWPNKARIAVVVSCLLENWSDGKGPPFSVQTTALKPGTPDRAAAMWGTYGGRAGVWRLLKILDENRVPATFIANARSMELHPGAVSQIIKSGHEIAAHSYTQDTILAYLSPDEEKSVIGRCIDVFKRMTGAPPKGWLSPVVSPTEHTEAFLAEAGFLWYGDYNNLDLPCRVRTPKGTIVALPHSDFADHRVLRANPRDWFDVYKDTFDYLYQNEPTSYLNVTVHCHFGGRPLMAAIIDRALKYIRGFPDVWIVRHDELAQWILDNGIDEWTNAERFFGVPPDHR
ncbi:MAG TPA: polysaccharide deacetylase family protein [Xanthobacteraceae bacterium]|nr:polysaccharide deacetylase family protein [Xanthobacteraceae bacterium]